MKTFKKHVAAAKEAMKIIYTDAFIGMKHPDDPKPTKSADKKKTVKESYERIKARRGSQAAGSYHDKLDQELEKRHHGNVSDDQHTHIREYTEDSDGVNAPLHKGEEANDEHLSSAIKQNKLHRHVTVYSGMRSPEDHPKSPDGKRHVHLPAYTSTSINPRSAKSFSVSTKQDGTPSSHVYWHRDPDHEGEHAHEQHEKFDPKNPKHVQSKADAKDMLEPHDDTSKAKGRARSLASGGKWVRYRHMGAIKAPKGTRSLYMGNNNEFTDHGESELVLHKNAKVAFHKHEVDHDSKSVIWHGKVTHDGVEKTRHHD